MFQQNKSDPKMFSGLFVFEYLHILTAGGCAFIIKEGRKDLECFI